MQLTTDMWKESLIILKCRLLLPLTWLHVALKRLLLHSRTQWASLCLLLYETTAQSRKQAEKKPNFISIFMHFHYILINKEEKNSHQEMLFLVKATMNRKFSKACVSKNPVVEF